MGISAARSKKMRYTNKGLFVPAFDLLLIIYALADAMQVVRLARTARRAFWMHAQATACRPEVTWSVAAAPNAFFYQKRHFRILVIPRPSYFEVGLDTIGRVTHMGDSHPSLFVLV